MKKQPEGITSSKKKYHDLFLKTWLCYLETGGRGGKKTDRRSESAMKGEGNCLARKEEEMTGSTDHIELGGGCSSLFHTKGEGKRRELSSGPSQYRKGGERKTFP